MEWQPVHANASNRPILHDGEYTAYIRDNIGIYQGQSKIEGRQNGRIYLTNLRLIYLDNTTPKNNLALDMTRIDGYTQVEGFLKRSPKVKLFISEKVAPVELAITWVCKICSYANESKSIHNDDTKLVCVNCGIPMAKGELEKLLSAKVDNNKQTPSGASPLKENICPVCTFINHSSMKSCEMCGTGLKRTSPAESRGQSPAISLEGRKTPTYSDDKLYIKLAFRKGGDSKFCQHLQQVLDDIQWKKLRSAGKINTNGKLQEDKATPVVRGGISGLEQRGEQQRQFNQTVLTTSLTDLDQLMFKFEDLLKLTGQTKSKLIIPSMKLNPSGSTYVREMARLISEYCLDQALASKAAMITTQDLFAKFNRHLITTQGFGASLINATNFDDALGLFDDLKLPLALRKYSSGVVVASKLTVEYSEYISHYMRQQYIQWVESKWRVIASGQEWSSSEVSPYFRGNTIAEICNHFDWNYNIAMEEIDRCIDNGVVVVDENIQGTFYFLNIFDATNYEVDEEEIKKRAEEAVAMQQKEIRETLRQDFIDENQLVMMNDYEFGGERNEEVGEEVEESAVGSGEGSREGLRDGDESIPSSYLNDLSSLKW